MPASMELTLLAINAIEMVGDDTTLNTFTLITLNAIDFCTTLSAGAFTSYPNAFLKMSVQETQYLTKQYMTDKKRKCNPIVNAHFYGDSDYFDVVTAPQVAILFMDFKNDNLTYKNKMSAEQKSAAL